jgi:hypothetical protein
VSGLPHDRTWNLAQVAAFFGHHETWLYRRIKKLQDDKGFPRPLIGHRYDPLAILAWRLAQMPPACRAAMQTVIPPALPGDPNAAFDPERWADELDRRAMAIGGSAE